MFSYPEAFLRTLAFRRAIRAIKDAQKDSWYVADLLRIRLEGGLSTPGEVLAALKARKTHSDPESRFGEQPDL